MLALIFCLATRNGLFSLPPLQIIQPGHWAYDALALLSREQGRVFFADSRVTVAEMERFIGEIDAARLSDGALAVYDHLTAYLESSTWIDFGSDAVSGGLDLVLQPEFFFKTNENNPWIYDGPSRNPLVLAPIGFSFGSWMTAGMDMFLGENEYAATLHRNYGNIPLDPVPQTDIHFPKRAYVSAGFPAGKFSGFNFAVGIGDNFFGKTRTGSVILSEYLERTAYAQASIYTPAFKYTAQVLQYEVNKYHYMHYLQLRPHRAISISIAEGVMVNAPLELRFLNPFTIFHGYESYKTYIDYNEDQDHYQNHGIPLEDLWDKNPDGTDKYDRTSDPRNHSRVGSYLGIKIEFQPRPLSRYYGLFAMNQFNLPMKKTYWGEGLYPDAAAFQAGAEFSRPTEKGYWEFGFEGVYTYPYMYVLWDKSWSFYKEFTELEMRPSAFRYWTGTPYGPDTVAGTVWAAFRSPEAWYAGFSFEFSARGERSEFTIFDRDNSLEDTYRPNHNVQDVTISPTGIPVFTYTPSFRFEYAPREWLSLTFQPGWSIAVNSGHEEGRIEQGFECALSVRLSFPVNSLWENRENTEKGRRSRAFGKTALL